MKRPEPGIHRSFHVPECYPSADLRKAEKKMGHFTE